MKHARAFAAQRYPNALVLEAKPRLVWIPTKTGRIPRSIAEDIFGMFDLLVLPPQSRIALLQITTLTDGKVSAASKRKTKIGAWMRETFTAADPPPWMGRVSVMGWIPRKHFRVWMWAFQAQEWIEMEPQKAPLPKAKGKAPVSTPRGLDCTGGS